LKKTKAKKARVRFAGDGGRLTRSAGRKTYPLLQKAGGAATSYLRKTKRWEEQKSSLLHVVEAKGKGLSTKVRLV